MQYSQKLSLAAPRAATFFALVAAAVIAVTATPASAQPASILAEGAMLATGGGASADGNYTLTFTLYDAQTGGKKLWSEGAQVAVIGGRFRHALGTTTPLAANVISGAKQVWLGVAVDQEPELQRQRVHSVAFSLLAGFAQNAGNAATAKEADSAKEAAVAKGLNCSGCVSIAALKFDGDIDVGNHVLKAAQIVTKQVQAGSVVATSFTGDGSKLTGITASKLLGAKCGKDEVVAGINADGKLACTKGSGALPPDGLAAVSNDLLTNQFVYTAKSSTPAPIPDNNPSGVSSTIVVPDYGIAQKLTISADVANSETAALTLTLTDPKGGMHVLWDKNAKGAVIKAQWPPAKLTKGDLGAWIGSNPKGKWTLTAVDSQYKDNKADGAINSWSVAVQVVSNQVAAANKGFTVNGHLKAAGSFQFPVSESDPVKCDADHVGYAYVNPKTKHLFVCNGSKYGQVSIVPELGSPENPALSCLDLLNKRPELAKADGNYSIRPKAKTIVAWCDMTTDGGGYTNYAVASGASSCKHTDNNACKDLGMDMVFPRTKSHWTSLIKKYGAGYFTTVPGVYKASSGGNYTGCPMRHSSFGNACSGWRVPDNGRWWLRDSNYSEPNGDYTANCWLSMYKHDVNDLQFNDGGCSYCTTKYVCSTNDKK